MNARLSRSIIATLSFVSDVPVVRNTPARHPIRFVSNRIVPWAARVAYQPGPISVNGVLMHVPRPPDWGGGGEFHMVTGTYERPEMSFIASRLKRGDLFVDVGAHVGYLALPAAKLVGPTGRVLAIEATSSAAQHLRENARLNGFDWLTVVEAAACDHTGFATLATNTHSAMWNRLSEEHDTGVQVPAVTVDCLMQELGWPDLAGLKVDVEGAEVRVLQGAAKTLRRNPGGFLILEMQGSGREESSIESLDYLVGLGYVFRRPRWSSRIPRPISPAEIVRDVRHGELFNVIAEMPR